MQEEGSLPSERSGEGGAKRRSAQAKRGRLGCLLRAPEAEPLRKCRFSLIRTIFLKKYNFTRYEPVWLVQRRWDLAGGDG